MMKKTVRRALALALGALMLLGSVGCAAKTPAETTGEGSGTSGDVGEPTTAPMQTLEPMADSTADNYRTFYQIFVGSFSDGNGDGVGDLSGIIQRFDYLNDGNVNSETSLGVQGIWLSPIFSSPSYHKYDASDYYAIDWRFGTESTLKELADLCESRNVKLIMDLAINHTSSQHPWFLAFKQARLDGDTQNPYYDYYTCVKEDEKVGGRTYQQLGKGWYYECNFSGDMPELNFDNETVREEMLNVARHYMDLGVDGFRFDAVKYIYYGDTAKSVEFWNWYMAQLRAEYPDIYCVGECWSGESEILSYYSAMNCFNFAMSGAEGKAAYTAKGNSLASFTGYVVSYQNKLLAANADGMAVSFLSNHDQDRIAGTFVLESDMRMAANLYLLSPGSPVMYYGEEIGLKGSRGSASTDANRRLAMLWGDGDLVRDPVGSTYDKQIDSSVAEQLADENSLLRYYCKLLSVRHRHPAIARGVYSVVATSHNNLGGFLVEYEGEKLAILHNNSNETITIDLASCKALQGIDLTVLGEIIGSGSATLVGTQLTVEGKTSVVIW